MCEFCPEPAGHPRYFAAGQSGARQDRLVCTGLSRLLYCKMAQIWYVYFILYL